MTVQDITVVRSVAEVRKYRQAWSHEGLKVGFVATMGFLHAGHQSLIRESLAENDRTIVSIFVNPSQFAPGEDLDAYPRNLEHDLQVLKETATTDGHGVSLVFAPTVTEMYPSGIPLDVDAQKGAFVSVKGLSEPLEGRTRPLFFRGVATVVSKLFNIVQPDNTYFGQKDVQQTVVLRRMIKDLFIPVKFHLCPIVRNDSGLALSSRNAYLSDEVQKRATVLYRSLSQAESSYTKGQLDANKLIELVKTQIAKEAPEFKPDYVAINDRDDLRYLAEIDPAKGCIISLAYYVPNDLQDSKKGTTRLIDNCIFPPMH